MIFVSNISNYEKQFEYKEHKNNRLSELLVTMIIKNMF